ncbi:MAG TPA: hypothetical protein VF765_36555 [Polyangiaceae bacterium]
MGPGAIVLLVAGILLFVGLIQAAVWIPIVRKLRRLPERVRAELAASGEAVVRAPERGTYRGSSHPEFPRAAGTGVMALTERRLVFRGIAGRPIDVPTARIRGVRQDTWFRSSARAGWVHVIVAVDGHGEVGFHARDPDAWAQALLRAAGLPVPS